MLSIVSPKRSAISIPCPTRSANPSDKISSIDENAAHFMFYENWESRELWQAHMGAPHLAAYMAATEGAVDQFVLNEMSLIN